MTGIVARSEKLSARALDMLDKWAKHAEKFVYHPKGRPGEACYGSGYNAWGVQTNQKYCSAMAVLAKADGKAGHKFDRGLALERALSTLRFSLASHHSGAGCCTDGSKWGRTWISSLGIERMMHGVHKLDPELTGADRENLKNMLVDESTWLLEKYERSNGAPGVVKANVWNHTGHNDPESNLWNGAVLWRTAAMYPDHQRAAEWREKACVFLVNSISVQADAENTGMLDGKRICDRHIGANFFPNYALDHHGYLNVGYMVICLSNVAMLHFDMKARGLPAPESLHHHAADLWKVVRPMIFEDGRLARIGGDSRVRYAYCQEFLMPALLYAFDCLKDSGALDLLEAQIKLMETEAAYNGDGGFYSERCKTIARKSPYYYTRLESDRACVLGQYCAYQPLAFDKTVSDMPSAGDADVYQWHEPEHGAVMCRSKKRLASFAWRAYGLAQGICQPPDRGDICEWDSNLFGVTRFAGSRTPGARPKHRGLNEYHTAVFQGGFLTFGSVYEGANVVIPEGWSGANLARHYFVFAALPDDTTVVGVEYCVLGPCRAYLEEVKGLHFNIGNDLFNGFKRKLQTDSGCMALSGPPETDEIIQTGKKWALIDGCIGVAGLYGAEGLSISRSASRRGGEFQSLYVEELCWPCSTEPFWAEPGSALIDCAWTVLSGVDKNNVESFAGDQRNRAVQMPDPLCRAVVVVGADGKTYLIAANFGDNPCSVDCRIFGDDFEALYEPATGRTIDSNGKLVCNPGAAGFFLVKGV